MAIVRLRASSRLFARLLVRPASTESSSHGGRKPMINFNSKSRTHGERGLSLYYCGLAESCRVSQVWKRGNHMRELRRTSSRTLLHSASGPSFLLHLHPLPHYPHRNPRRRNQQAQVLLHQAICLKLTMKTFSTCLNDIRGGLL